MTLRTPSAPMAILLVLVAAIVMAAAGCGGSGEGASSATTEPTPTAALTHAAYLKRANAACKEARESLAEDVARFARIRRGREKAPRVYYDELARYVLLPKIEDELEAVRALGAVPGPPAEEQEVNHLLYTKELAMNEIAVKKTVPSLAFVDQAFERSSRELREYGLPVCDRGPEATRFGKGLIAG